MEALARRALRRPVEIQVGGRSVVPPSVRQHVEVRSEDDKFLRLLELLGQLYVGCAACARAPSAGEFAGG